ncbi:MAG TPA: hypothetical protein VMZ92_08180 [Planctomycetota bacterium]|nr:hypothetical protein [Planctomycetota bacterium]
MKRLTAAALVTVLLLAPVTASADNAFYRILAAKPNASFEDAVRAFFNLALDTEAGQRSFDEQAQALIDMKVIRKKWTRNPKAPLTRGRAAYMICRTCGIRGGITMTLLGTSERYAFRECRYLEAWADGNQADRMTGGEVLGILKWAADYIEEHPKGKVKPRGSAASLQQAAPAPKPDTAGSIADELDAAERAKKK